MINKIKNYLAWTGAAALSVCGVPQAIQSIQQGHSQGVNGWFLVIWTIGELCTLAYICLEPSVRSSKPLMTNYLLNALIVGVIGYYKIIGG